MSINVNWKQSIPSDREISENLLTPIILICLKKEVGKLTSAKDIFSSYCTTRLTCKYLYNYASSEKSDDLRKYLKINEVKTDVFTNVFNELVKRSSKNESRVRGAIHFISLDLSVQMKQLLIEKKIQELFLLIDKMLPQKRDVERQALEYVIAKVIGEPYSLFNECDHMLTKLSLICAKADACATVQVFPKIPIHFLKSGEEIGKECARNDPEATLKYLDNFKNLLVLTSWASVITTYVESILAEANLQIQKNASLSS